MYTSFYTAARGAMEEQQKLNVVANNLANVNNYGYKAKVPVFADLMYYNLNNYNGDDTPLKAGTGILVEQTKTDFSPKGLVTTQGDFDYAIIDSGFFMMRSPVTNEITYTRNGHFHLGEMEDGFYLTTDAGKLVLDQYQKPIKAEVPEMKNEEEEDED